MKVDEIQVSFFKGRFLAWSKTIKITKAVYCILQIRVYCRNVRSLFVVSNHCFRYMCVCILSVYIYLSTHVYNTSQTAHVYNTSQTALLPRISPTICSSKTSMSLKLHFLHEMFLLLHDKRSVCQLPDPPGVYVCVMRSMQPSGFPAPTKVCGRLFIFFFFLLGILFVCIFVLHSLFVCTLRSWLWYCKSQREFTYFGCMLFCTDQRSGNTAQFSYQRHTL